MSTVGATQSVSRQVIDIGSVLKRAWHLFVDDIGPLIIAALVATALAVVTIGVLAGPLYAGLYRMVLDRISHGKQPHVGDVFSCMDRFWTFLFAGLALLLLVGLASITVVGGILLATIWLYVFPLMVDRGMGLGAAMSASYDTVKRAGFWEHLALVILLGVLNSLASGPLMLLSVPFTVVAIVVAYNSVSDGTGAVVGVVDAGASA